VVEAPIYLQDVMATALDVAGVKKPEHVEFQSLLPLIRGESTRATAEPVYGAYLQLQRAVIADGMKLVVYPKAGVVRLFDLKADPEEMKDLAEVPEMKGKRAALLAKLREVQAARGDGLDLGELGQSE
jgi:arylsulfatase A-like enzyme